MLRNKKCLYAFTGGVPKDSEGTFLEFAPQVVYDEAGEPTSTTTKAIIMAKNGDIVQVDPAGVKILDSQ